MNRVFLSSISAIAGGAIVHVTEKETMNQLKENINSFKISLSKSILDEIEKIHNEIPDPAP